MISATIENWNDVIEFKIFGRAAVRAHHSGPFSPLSGSELFPMSAKFRRFVIDTCLPPWENFKHFITVQTPQFAGSLGNSLLCLLCVPVAGSILITKSLSFSAFRNFALCRIGMLSSPERIIFSGIVNTYTGVGTEADLPFSDSPRLTEKFTTTGFTLKSLPWFVLHLITHRMPPSDNGVNSENNSTLCFLIEKVKRIMELTLSQARGETSLKVQRLRDEAKAAKSHASNFPQERPTRKG